MTYRIGIDVGGTFTDFLVIDEEGSIESHKILSTPKDPSIAVLDGLREIAEKRGETLQDFLKRTAVIVHGTTIATNAVLTRSGSAAFITTKGFRDTLNLRQGVKDETRLWDTKYNLPEPFIRRRYIYPVEERIDCEGHIITPLKEEDVYEAIKKIKENKIPSVGICFLHSWINPIHERKVAEIIRKELPNVYTSVSTEIFPQVRFYERTCITALNAYVGPMVEYYLKNLSARVKENGFKGILRIMQSNGGIITPERAVKLAGTLLNSGPAGGPLSGLIYAGLHKINNIITCDMGGTSFDASLIREGEISVTVEMLIEGFKWAVPSIDVRSIGAGGGSIAWVDPGKLLHVGPQSAGAEPGPACYGKGGKEPTVTDADLILGYLNPDFFWGGRLKLDTEAAEKVIKEKVADLLNMDVVQAAWGIYRVVNSNMAANINIISMRKGLDPREFTIVMAGGAGPVHAWAIARELGVELEIIPRESSVFCALGMLISDFRHDFIRSYVTDLTEEKIDFDHINSLIEELRNEATNTLKEEGIAEKDMKFEYFCDIRYVGQVNEVATPLQLKKDDKFLKEDLPVLLKNFHEKHEILYGYSLPHFPVELLNIRLKAIGITPKPEIRRLPYMGPDATRKTSRKAFFGEEFINVDVYDGEKIGYGNRIEGPAIIEYPTTTIVVPPDAELFCDALGSICLYPKDKAEKYSFLRK